ncbi:MAG: RNA polymerase sigma factor [Pseudomonadota bacterium]
MSTPFRDQLITLLPRLKRFALGLTVDATEADDLVQAACERALARQAQWQPGTRLDSWLFKITQNLWIDRLRARGPVDDLEPELLAQLPAADWQQGFEQSLMLGQVLQAMQQLPAPMRAVLMLVCVEDLSYREAAATLDVPIGTVMSRLARARAALHAILGEHHAHL